MSDSEKYYLIETEKDYCIVEEDSIDGDDSFLIGDKVSFKYSRNARNKKTLKGTIRFCSDSESACQAEAKRLKEEARDARQSSFHEDKPRKAAIKFKESLKRNIQNGDKPKKEIKKPKVDSAVEKMQDIVAGELLLKQSRKKKKNVISSDEEGSDNSTLEARSVASSKDFNDSDEEKAIHVKSLADELASKFDAKELQKLLKRANKSDKIGGSSHSRMTSLSKYDSFDWGNDDYLGDKNEVSTGEKRDKSDEFKRDENKTNCDGEDKDKADSGGKKKQVTVDKEKPNGASSSKKRLVVPRHHVHGVNNNFKGKMYAVDDTSTAQEVFTGTGIYCSQVAFDRADVASSATMAARRLLDGVFTEEALQSCSVSGLPPRGKGKAAYKDSTSGAIKPFLCPKAVNAIVCLSIAWQKSKHFIKKKDDAQIRQAIAVRLNEIQALKKLKDADEDKSE